MIKPTQFHNPFLFLVGFIAGIGIALVVVIGITWVIEQIGATEGRVPALPASNETNEASNSGDELQDQSEELFDTIISSRYTSSRFVKKAILYTLVLEANTTQLGEILDASQSLPDRSWRQEIESAILQRLVSFDPVRAIDYARESAAEHRKQLLDSVFHELSLQDLQKAIDAGRSLEFPDRDFALQTILRNTVELPEDQRIALGQRFGDERLARRSIEVNQAMALIDNTHRAWEVMIGDGVDVRFRLDSIVDLAQTWISKDGIGVLSEILEYDRDSFGLSVLDRVIVRAIARANPEEIFRLVVVNPDLQFLITEIATVWTASDPLGALRGVSRLDDARDRDRLTRTIIYSWSEINPRELLDNRAVFPREMQLDAISAAIRAIARIDRYEAVRLMETLRTEGVNTSHIGVWLVNDWSVNDPQSTLEWVLSGANEQNPDFGRMVEIAVSRLVHVDSERAMELALNPLSPKWPTGLDYYVIWELSRADLDAARELIPFVSEDSRSKCYRRVGFGYVETGQPERALELAEQLAINERYDYYSAILDYWASSNPSQLLEAIEYLPSPKFQALAAESLVYRNGLRHFFSEKQVERVNSYLSEEGNE
ncbi:MAG: hypothetical protein OXG08_09490 [Gammaproteobacteria bacterium]|nr:hypothetical protein [Gammaproteobacteria bacterium]